MELPLLLARFFVERLPAAGETIRLPAGEAAHARARRLGAGDAVVLFDGSGREAAARIGLVGRAGVRVRAETVADSADAGAAISLHVAGIRAERMSWIAEKATELAAARLVLLRSERTQAFRAGEALRQRLERVARAAAKQIGASRWPEIAGPLAVEQALRADGSRHRFFLDPEGEPFPAVLSAGAAALAVGPEGGWTRPELALARGLGWTAVSLPAAGLRTETAAIAGLVLLRAALSRSEPEA